VGFLFVGMTTGPHGLQCAHSGQSDQPIRSKLITRSGRN
jgi:hypothetical protein